MSLLGREQIVAAVAKPRIEKVDAFGGKVCVRGLTALERDHWETSLSELNRQPEKSFRASLVVLGLCDEAGKRLFTDAEMSLLGSAPADDIDLLFDKVRDLSGMNRKAREEIEKNSNGAPGDATSSG